jgi:hypothetical protein
LGLKSNHQLCANHGFNSSKLITPSIGQQWRAKGILISNMHKALSVGMELRTFNFIYKKALRKIEGLFYMSF